MSVFKEFNELNLTTKTIILSVAVTMPFWYIDLYFLSNITLEKNIQIPIVISFCLSICWYALNLVSNAVFFHVIPGGKPAAVGGVDIMFSTFYSIGLLALLSFIWYVLELKFRSIVYFGFGFGVFRIFIWMLMSTNKKK